MKKLLSVLSSALQGGIRGGFLILALLATTSLWAFDFKSGDLYYTITSDTTVEVAQPHYVSQYGDLTMVTIPESVIYKDRTYTVTAIGEKAFSGCSSLVSITIPENIKCIGYHAFYNTGIYLEKSNWENSLLYIDNCLVHADDHEITSCIVKQNTRLVAEGIFAFCSNLTSVVAEDGNTKYDSRDNCNAIIETTTNTLVAGCKKTTIPNSVMSIGDYAFYDCSSLTSVTLPNSVTSIGKRAFCDCRSLTSITIPKNVTSIGVEAFRRCYELTSVSIGEGVMSIGESAFCECSKLTSVAVGNGVMSVGHLAFAQTPFYENQPDGVVYIGKVLYKYKGTMPANTSIDIVDGTISIGEQAFYDCSSLTSVTLPNSVTNIGKLAFYGCSGLTSVTLPNNLTSIETSTFASCESISSISIPDNVKYIGKSAFIYCINLKTITIGKNVEQIGENAFYSLKSGSIIYSFAPIPPILGSWAFPWKCSKLIVDANSKEAYMNNDSWSQTASEIIAYGELFWGEWTQQIGHKSASFSIAVCNYDKNETYNIGYIWNNDTIRIETADTIKIDLNGLDMNTKYNITFYAVKTDEPIENGLIMTRSFKTKDITVALNISNSTQTKISLSLVSDYGDCGTTKEQGIIMTHPDEKNDTIILGHNQTDTIIDSLIPNSNYRCIGYWINAENDKIYTSKSYTCKTKDVAVVISNASQTQTTLNVGIRYNSGDATVIDKGLVVHFPNGNIDTMSIWNSRYRGEMLADTLFTNLRVDTEYDMYGFVRTAEGGLKVGNGSTLYTKNIEGTITSPSCTQTTLSLSATLGLGDAIDYGKNGLEIVGGSKNTTIYFEEGVFTLDTTFTNLSPSTKYSFKLLYIGKDSDGKEYISYSDTKTFSTNPVYLSEPTLQATGQTFIEVQTSNVYGDANLIEEVVEVTTNKNNTPEHRVHVAGRSNVIINNLMPDTKYYFRNVLSTQETGTMYSEWYEATTEQITLATGEADGISNSSAFLHGTIDCDTMSRTEIGFEWKRSDAPSTVKPQRLLVVDRVDENLIFRLEGLSSDRYYDFRTFCLYNGKEYYGEWVGFLTSDKDIVVPPSVQTREAEITELGVKMKGFIVAGTEVILQRGFECWREESDQVATTVAEGAVMSSYIPEVWSYTTYKYRAYAKTPAGTTYGETLEVTTEYIATDIVDIVVNASARSAQVSWTIVEQADYYILTLYSDESMTEVLGVYTVDKDGNITQKRVSAATKSLVTCELTDLLPETNYYFDVKAYNNNDQMVAEENGSFATTVVPTYVENTHTQSPMTDCQKIIRNGQLLILRDDKTYTIMGAEVK